MDPADAKQYAVIARRGRPVAALIPAHLLRRPAEEPAPDPMLAVAAEVRSAFDEERSRQSEALASLTPPGPRNRAERRARR